MPKILIACSDGSESFFDEIKDVEIEFTQVAHLAESLKTSRPDAVLVELVSWNEDVIRTLEQQAKAYLKAWVFVDDFSSVPQLQNWNTHQIQCEFGRIPWDLHYLRFLLSQAFASLKDRPRSGEWTFKKLFLLNPTPMFAYDFEHYNILMANKAATELYGYTEHEFQQLTILDIRPKEDIGQLIETLKNDADRLFYDHGQWRHLKKNGELMYVNILGFNLEFNQRPIRLIAVHDVTSHMEREQKIRFQSTILENITDSVVATDLDGRVIYYNQGAVDMFGYSMEEMMGKKPINMYPEINDRRFEEILLEIRTKGQITQERVAQHKDGRPLRVRVNSSILYDVNNQEIGYVGIAKDVTPIYSYMEQVQEKASQLNHILESIKEGFFTLDFNNVVLQWNNAAAQMLKIEASTLIGKDLWTVFDVNAESKFYTEYERCRRERVHVEYTEYFAPLDIWFEVDVIPTNFGYSVFFRDVSEQVKFNQHLKMMNDRYRLAALASNDIIWEWDIPSETMYLSDAYLRILKLPSDSPTSGPITIWTDYIHPEDKDWVNDSVFSVVAGADVNFWQERYRLISTDGETVNIVDSGYAIRDEQGKVIRLVGATHDETEQVRQKNKIANDLKEKEVLLKEIHHRVKNNMAVINSLLYLYSSRVNSEAFDEAVTEITQRIKTMALIHDMLYQDKYLGIVDLASYVQELITAVSESYQVGSDIEVHTAVDEIKLELNLAVPLALILNEMLSNALKHAFVNRERGNISISARKIQNKLFIELKDDGIGFQKELVHEDRLGLVLMKDLARQINAEIQMQSESNKGTNFLILMPLKSL